MVAIRLGMRGVVTANLALSIIIIYVTATRGGLFHGESLSKSLLGAQLFLAVLTISNMVLAATTEERMHLYVEAKRELAIRDEFLSVASHELKTPLTLMSLRIPLVVVRAITHCERQTRQLAAWVDELLDLSRIRFGKLHLSKELLDLGQVASEALEQFRSELNRKNISFTLQRTEPTPGNWDRTRSS